MCRLILPLLLCFVVRIPNAIAETIVDELLTTGTSWDGSKFSYPRGSPEVTAIILRMDEGDETGFHCHPVPALGYILKGTLAVEADSGEEVIFQAGDAAVELVGKLHKGRAVDGPVELVAFYVGVAGVQNSITAQQLNEDPAACTGQYSGNGEQETDIR